MIAIVADPIRKVCGSNKFQALEEDEQTEDEEQTKNHGWNPWITVLDNTTKKTEQEKNNETRKTKGGSWDKQLETGKKMKKVSWKAKQAEQSETNCISCLEDYGQVVEEMICEVTEGSNKEKGK